MKKNSKEEKYKKALEDIVNYKDAFEDSFIMNHEVKKYVLKTAKNALIDNITPTSPASDSEV